MKRASLTKNITYAISLVLLLLLLTNGCSTRNESSMQPTIPPALWNTPTPIGGPQPNSNGAMVRANVHGTGVYVTKGVRQLTGLKWKFASDMRRTITIPVIQGSTLFFGRDGSLYAVDAGTGAEKWNYKVDNQHTAAPAVAGNTLYLGGWEILYALNIDTGTFEWSYLPESGSDDRYFFDPVVDSGTLYFGGWHHFYAIDTESRHEKWKVKLDAITRSVPTVYEGIVYVGTFSPDIQGSGYLYALDSKTGQEQWKLKATDGGIVGAVAASEGVVYVATHDYGLLALDAKSGREKWRYRVESGFASAPAVAYDTVYITNPIEGTLHAIDAPTGNEKWQIKMSGSFNSDPIIAEGIVYTSSSDANLGILFGGEMTGYLHAIDAISGQKLWTYSIEGSPSEGPAVADGTVYFGSDTGHFYAVR